VGAAHRDWEQTANNLRSALRDQLWELKSQSAEELIEKRYDRFRTLGVFEDPV
jgi:acetyl-CoA carboxylase carboxyl transferase subunit alpha